MYSAIPNELKALKQWICWRYEDIGARKPTKVPYNPTTNKHANVNDPETWVSFECAASVIGYDGIGFVFSDDDPYTFIDLDNCRFLANGDINPKYEIDLNRQIQIFNEFESYSEISPSGEGLHVIIKGKVSSGRKRSFIEVYSSQRYATFTGRVYKHAHINERQDLLNQLWVQLGAGQVMTHCYEGDEIERVTDDKVLQQAQDAINGDKFNHLLHGNWQHLYTSQSEADFAFIDILAFYTQNRKQINRIFLSSTLGKRTKAKRKDYVDWMINKSFDHLLPPIDFDGFKNKIEERIQQLNDDKRSNENLQNAMEIEKFSLHENEQKRISKNAFGKNENLATGIQNDIEMRNLSGKSSGLSGLSSQRPEAKENASIKNVYRNEEYQNSNGRNQEVHGDMCELSSETSSSGETYLIPSGLMGEIAQFVYQASPRPVPEIALAAAIGLMAGIAGRAYNVNGEGLNTYVLLIAQSGTGKEGMASGIDKLMNSIKLQIPTSNRVIGPSEISSGEALISYINSTSQCFVSILGEFGYRLQSLTDKNNAAQLTLKKVILDLYHKSGQGRVFRPKIFSDKAKNITETISPSFSILAESTPSTFYDCITEEMVADGFLPRFSIIEYKGVRVALNENCSNIYPAHWLIDKLGSFVANCEVLNYHKRVIDIKSTKEAANELHKFDKYADAVINKNEKENIRQLWNRAHIKAWKLSGLIAVGVNMIEPEITIDHVKWALKLVQHDINTMSSKFEAGEIGQNTQEIKQNRDIIKTAKDFLLHDWEYVAKYCKDAKIKQMHGDKVIPYAFFNRKLVSMASFRNDRNGATFALKRALLILLESDKVREVNRSEMSVKYGSTQRAFMVVDLSIFD